jgi:CRP/FNR family transcriptional regulator
LRRDANCGGNTDKLSHMQTTITADFLGQIGATERDKLLKLGRRRSFRKGEFVFRLGDHGDRVYFLLSGRLKFFRLAPNGREVILWFCFPGEVFGMTEVNDARGRRVNVQTCEASQVATLPEAAFNHYLDTHPDAARLCRRVMSARLGVLANVLVNLVVDDAHTRIAKLILHLGARYGLRRGEEIYLQMPLTHQEIANMTGVNRQTASRILSEFRRKGLLSINNRRIHIESEEKLADLTQRIT